MKRYEILMKMRILAGSLSRQGELMEFDLDNGDNDITVRMIKRTMKDIKKVMGQLEAFEKLL